MDEEELKEMFDEKNEPQWMKDACDYLPFRVYMRLKLIQLQNPRSEEYKYHLIARYGTAYKCGCGCYYAPHKFCSEFVHDE